MTFWQVGGGVIDPPEPGERPCLGQHVASGAVLGQRLVVVACVPTHDRRQGRRAPRDRSARFASSRSRPRRIQMSSARFAAAVPRGASESRYQHSGRSFRASLLRPRGPRCSRESSALLRTWWQRPATTSGEPSLKARMPSRQSRCAGIRRPILGDSGATLLESHAIAARAMPARQFAGGGFPDCRR